MNGLDMIRIFSEKNQKKKYDELEGYRHSNKIYTRLQSKVHHRKCPFDLTKASAKFKIDTSNGLDGDAFT